MIDAFPATKRPGLASKDGLAALLLCSLSGDDMTLRAILVILGCLGFASSAAAQSKAALGEKVFADQKCGLCHSIGSQGNKKGPLDGVGAKPEAELREWIVDAKGMTAKTKAARKPVMKAYSLPKDDVDNLVAYLLTLKK
jgi:mono/diheme cytochrome c family protein